MKPLLVALFGFYSCALLAQELNLETPKYILRNKDFVDRRSGVSQQSFAKSYYQGYNEYLALKGNVSFKRANSWTPAGPAGKTRLSGTGRINSITFHPTDTATLFICVAQGGVWKSSNSGASWVSISSDLPILRTSSLAIHPTKTNTMYLAVGDIEYLGHNLYANENKRNTHYGLGVYKTTDGGASWKPTGLSFKQTDFEGSLLSNVLINSKNPNMVMAAGETGCYLSTDGGDNWSKTQSGIFWDVKVSPNNPNELFAATGYISSYDKGEAGILRSVDFGKTWKKAIVPFATTKQVQRIELATCKSNAARVYALASNELSSSGFQGIYVSNDTGKTYSAVITASNYPYNLLGWGFDNEAGGQGRYDLAFWVDDNDDQILHVGGVNMWSSKDGGENFLPVSKWQLNYRHESIHADIHEIRQHPITKKIFVCHDGGLSSTKLVTPVSVSDIEQDVTATIWHHHIDNLSTLSFYRLGLNPTDGNQIVAGAQDNSTAYRYDSIWSNLTGGDGMECLFDPNGFIYTSSQYGFLNRLIDMGDGFVYYDDYTSAPSNEIAEWTTPMVLADGELYVGYGNLYTFDFSLNGPISNFPNGKNMSAPLPSSALYVEKESIERIYLAKRGYASLGIDGELFTSIDKGKNWTDISNGLPLNEYPSYVDADDRGPDTAWVTFASWQAGKKIYETRDGGKTWTNISYNLPNLPANCVAHQADRNNNLYVGMDLGIYRLDRKNKKWELYAEGFPNVIVSELEVHLADFKLKAATFGRGIWEADLEGVPDIIGVEEVLADQLEMNAFHDEMNNQLALELIGKHAKPLNLLVVDVTGRIVLNNSIQPNENRLTLNTRNWLPGMYYVTVSNGKTRISKGVVVE